MRSIPRRQQKFQRRTNPDGTQEDVYEWVSRTIMTARPREAVWFYMLRGGDEKQIRAWEFGMQTRMAYWTRIATITALVTSVMATAVAIVAIVAN